MKNVTIALPDEVYRRARVKAAERDTSLSALVREYLVSLGSEGSEFERRRALQRKVLGSVRRFSASDRVSRDAVHRRRAPR